eukprot:7045011-Prymnesium_polylepis.1
MRNVIRDNVRSAKVRCMCLASELTLREPERAVTLLVVDTEGFDYQNLAQYPFSSKDRHAPAETAEQW